MLKNNRIDGGGGGSRPPSSGPPMGPRGAGMRKSPPPPIDRGGYRGPPPRDGYDSYERIGPPQSRDRSPLRDSYDSRYKDYPPSRDDRMYSKRGDGRYPPPRDSYSSGPPADKPPLDKRYTAGPEPPYNKYSSRPEGPPPPAGDSYSSPARGAYSGPPPLQPNKPNDCEIIVINKMLQGYAESIEQRLKTLGLKVDLLFLKEEHLLGRAIDNLAANGCLYAMEVVEQNELHGSVTINILHTNPPQAHRNILLDDGLKLLACNFHEYIRTCRQPRPEPLPIGSFLPPTMEIQHLLYLLSDGRYLTAQEIDKIIKYLEERKDKMASYQAGQMAPPTGTEAPPSNEPPTSSAPPPSSKYPLPNQPPPNDGEQSAESLQQRIINLIMQPTGNNSSGQPPQPPNVEMSQQQGGSGGNQKEGSTYINFASPNVQQALDNLMQTGPSFLKNIASIPELQSKQQAPPGGYGPTATPQNSGGPPQQDRMMPSMGTMGKPAMDNPPQGYGGNHYGSGGGPPSQQQTNPYRHNYGNQMPGYHPRRY